MRRNPYAASLTRHRPQTIPDKREETVQKDDAKIAYAEQMRAAETSGLTHAEMPNRMREKGKGTESDVDFDERIEAFKASVKALSVGGRFVYHNGEIAIDRQTSLSLNVIGMLVMGLQMIGCVQCETKRVAPSRYEYAMRVIRPIREVDFDHGRKTYLESRE